MLYDDRKKLQRLLYYVYLFVSMLYFTAYDIVVRPIDYCSVSFTGGRVLWFLAAGPRKKKSLPAKQAKRCDDRHRAI